MKIKDVQRIIENKDIVMSIRTSKEDSEFMKKHNISPTKLFHKALEELKKEANE